MSLFPEWTSFTFTPVQADFRSVLVNFYIFDKTRVITLHPGVKQREKRRSVIRTENTDKSQAKAKWNTNQNHQTPCRFYSS